MQSVKSLFNTASKPVGQFIKEELDHARQTRREVSKKIQFAKSERVLYDYAKDSMTEPSLFTKEDSLKSSIYAARNHGGWQDYVKCGYKFAQPSPNKSKRV